VRGFLFILVFIVMMKIPQYSIFVKKVLECKNLLELREIVGKINDFNKINSIRSSSDDFKKLETIVGLMKIKLRNKQGVNESKNFMISETQLKTIVESNKTDRLVSEYLNYQDWSVWDIGDSEFNVADGEFGRDLIRFRIQYSSTVPDHHFNVIYISDDLVTKISGLFGVNNEIAIDSIIHWFNQKYDKNLTRDDFEWLDSDTYYADDDEDY
jgi:hypothetical protein